MDTFHDEGAFAEALAGTSERKNKTGAEIIQEKNKIIQKLNLEVQNSRSEMTTLRDQCFTQMKKNEKQSDLLNDNRKKVISLNAEVNTLKVNLEKTKKEQKASRSEIENMEQEITKLKTENNLLREDRVVTRKQNPRKVFCRDLITTGKKVEEFMKAKEKQTSDCVDKMIESAQILADRSKKRLTSQKRENLIKRLRKELN